MKFLVNELQYNGEEVSNGFNLYPRKVVNNHQFYVRKNSKGYYDVSYDFKSPMNFTFYGFLLFLISLILYVLNYRFLWLVSAIPFILGALLSILRLSRKEHVGDFLFAYYNSKRQFFKK